MQVKLGLRKVNKMVNDKFGQSLGLWHLTVGGADLELKPRMGDNRNFRKILLDEDNKKNKARMFEKFEEFMTNIIKRDYPNEGDRVPEYVELNTNELFEEVMVQFRWTTREELEKTKKESIEGIKKLIETS